MLRTTEMRIDIGKAGSVSALLCRPDAPRAAYVFAHGAGAGMTHTFMEAFATGLAERGVASLRYQFPFMEQGSKRPDSPAVAQATVRAACEAAAIALPGLPLFAGGKSFGGRMTSRAQAESPLPSIRGLVFVGFPLHPAKQPAIERAEHLARVNCPMLFLQGTRDDLADASLIESVVGGLGKTAEIAFFNDADHAFHVRKLSGSTDDQVRDAMLDAMLAWMDRTIAK